MAQLFYFATPRTKRPLLVQLPDSVGVRFTEGDPTKPATNTAKPEKVSLTLHGKMVAMQVPKTLLSADELISIGQQLITLGNDIKEI